MKRYLFPAREVMSLGGILAVIVAVVGYNAPGVSAAERVVLGEYFNALW